jgi:electron transfer flavoprotein beta subunit
MNILVLLKMVPDVVEELEVGADGKSLNTEFLRTIVNERDEHALEQALLLKERHGGKVTVLGVDAPELDDVLFTALAKGADRAVKITDAAPALGTRASAQLLAQVAPAFLPADLVLCGVQALDDLDGQVAPMLAQTLGLPYLGIVTQVTGGDGVATVVTEYPGGVRGEFEIALPAVLGVQAAEKPPRYVPVAKVRAVMKSQQIETVPAPTVETTGAEVRQLAKPQVTGHAEMLDGTPEEVAGKICDLLAQRGLL